MAMNGRRSRQGEIESDCNLFPGQHTERAADEGRVERDQHRLVTADVGDPGDDGFGDRRALLRISQPVGNGELVMKANRIERH